LLKRIERLFWLALIFASAALLIGFLIQRSYALAGLSLVLAVLWGWLDRRSYVWLPGTGLAVYLFFAAAGVLAGLPPTLMLICAVAALAAWDLERFLSRLKRVPADVHSAGLEKAHLHRLAWVLLVGFGLGVLALNLQFQIGLLPTAILALVIVYTLGRVVRSRA
jgi:hypothetical protein